MSPDRTCRLCDGACRGSNLEPLLVPELMWIWQAVAAAADRRGDPTLTTGKQITVHAPDDPAHRAAAISLLGGPAQPGQRRMVSLPALIDLVRRRGPTLTPGAVAAHAVRRPLAQHAIRSSQRIKALQGLAVALGARLRATPIPRAAIDPDQVVDGVRRAGNLARLLVVADPEQVMDDAIATLRMLPTPGNTVDRRLLAQQVLTDPHGLDEGRPVELLARAMLVAAGLVPPGTRARAAWSHLGVEWDEIGGGLNALGIHPEHWLLPPAAVVTLPPIELADCTWPSPEQRDSWVFVTENPSVLTAARRIVRGGTTARLLCTSGTPSETEVAAISRLAGAGWNLAVRADFDEWGLQHVRAILAAAPTATTWRMTAQDYLASLDTVRRAALPAGARLDSPWDASLADVMHVHGAATFEESLLPHLMADLVHGRPQR